MRGYHIAHIINTSPYVKGDFMNGWTGMFMTAILCGGMLFGASGQIDLHSNSWMRLTTGTSATFNMGGSTSSGHFTVNAGGTVRLDGYLVRSRGTVIDMEASNYIWLETPYLQINSSDKSSRHTNHFGDLHLLGGNLGASRGRLTANSAIIYGTLTLTGNKHFLHPHPTDESRAIRYIAIESGEALTVARGVARTENGQITINLPEHFSMVTSRNEPLTVMLTPKGVPVVLYVREESNERITVAMRNSDFAEFRDVEFSYQITGVRDGFENQDVVISVDELFDRNVGTNVRQSDAQRRVEAFEERLRTRSMDGVEEIIRLRDAGKLERGLTDEN